MYDINSNLIILLRKLVSDKELARGFSECKTLDEFYDYSSNITSGYMKEELHELLMGLSFLTLRGENDKIILRDDLENISGGKGMGNMVKKYMSGILAVLSMASVVPMTDFNAGATESNYVVAHKAPPKEDEEGIWKRLADDVAVGSAAGAIVGAAVYYALNAANNSSNSGFGLPNMSNSCYINATIQQLYSLREFRKRIMEDTSDNKKVVALKNIFMLISKGERIKASDITRFIGDLGYNGEQQDATEFLLSEAGLGEILSKYDLQDMFSAPLKLGESPKGTSLVELLRHGGNPDYEERREYVKKKFPSAVGFSDEEVNRLFSKISGEKLSKRHAKGKKSEKDMVDEAVRKLPPADRKKINKIHLNEGEIRGFNKPAETKPVKGQFGVIVNRTLNTAHGNVKSKNVVSVPDIMQKDGEYYCLTGSVVHVGDTMNSGHYYSYKKNLGSERWLCYDDDEVSAVPESAMKQDMERNGVLFIYTVLPD